MFNLKVFPKSSEKEPEKNAPNSVAKNAITCHFFNCRLCGEFKVLVFQSQSNASLFDPYQNDFSPLQEKFRCQNEISVG